MLGQNIIIEDEESTECVLIYVYFDSLNLIKMIEIIRLCENGRKMCNISRRSCLFEFGSGLCLLVFKDV